MASLRDIKIEGKLTPEALDISQCLRADKWIDHDHPDIIKKAKELTDDIEDDWEKVIAIFEFIRDKIVYNFAPVIENATDWKASSVLKQKKWHVSPKIKSASCIISGSTHSGRINLLIGCGLSIIKITL